MIQFPKPEDDTPVVDPDRHAKLAEHLERNGIHPSLTKAIARVFN